MSKMNLNLPHTDYNVSEASELLEFLLNTLNQSRSSVKKLLKYRQILVDGTVVTQFNHPLQSGQTVSVLSKKAIKQVAALEGIRILYEDDDLIAIDKEAGLLSMAGKNPDAPTAYRQLMQYVEVGNRDERIFIVHRLDRDTSGVMVFARSEKVKLTLQENWHETVKERKYHALVEGAVRNEADTITSWLTMSPSMRVHSSQFDNGGQHAITHYKKVQGNDDYSLLEVELETGRKNQIRVHLSDIGHPIVGDKKYRAKDNSLKRLALHASSLVLEHPTTKEILTLASKVPAGFVRLSK